MNIDLSGLKQGAINIQLYNGLVHVTNPKTGNIQLYRITSHRKEKYKTRYIEQGHFMSDTYVLFNNIGKIDERGEVSILESLQHSKRAETIHKHLNILNFPYHFMAQKGLLYASCTTCRRCGAELTDYDSVLTGIGPVCIGHWGLKEHAQRLKKGTDSTRFGELRQAIHDDDMPLAYLALGFIEQDEVRHTARRYLYTIRERAALAKSA